MTDNATNPPKHLSPARKALWRHVTNEYALEPQHVELLRLACEVLDRCEQARETLASDGLTVTNRYGNATAHPCVAIERDSRLAAARLLRELGLEEDVEG